MKMAKKSHGGRAGRVLAMLAALATLATLFSGCGAGSENGGIGLDDAIVKSAGYVDWLKAGAFGERFYGSNYIDSISWVYGVEDPNVLLASLNGWTAAKVRVISRQGAFFPALEATNTYAITPLTPMLVEVIDPVHLPAGASLGERETVLVAGGAVSVSEVIANCNPYSVEKTGLKSLSKNEADSLYMDFGSYADFNFVPGGEYILILAKDNRIVARGYGVFGIVGSQDQGTVRCRNSLSGKTFDIYRTVDPETGAIASLWVEVVESR